MNRWSSNYCWNSVNYTLRSMVTSMHQSITRTSNDQVLWLWHHSISLDHKIFMLQFPLFHAVDRQTGPHLSSISINPNPSFLPCFLIIPSFPCNHYWQDVVAQFSLLFDLLCNYYSAWVVIVKREGLASLIIPVYVQILIVLNVLSQVICMKTQLISHEHVSWIEP